MLLLKGKLDMLQKTIEFNKIISGKTQKTAKTDAKDTPLLVYKDAEDEDEEMDII